MREGDEMRPGASRRIRLAIAIAIAAATTIAGPARAQACADPAHPGGDWPMYGHDLSNTRSQSAETQIGRTNVATLTPQWMFTAQSQGGTGRFESTPVIAEGCLYMTTSSGFIYALNADTGELVWGKRLASTVSSVCCGGTLFAPAVHDGVVYVNVSSNPQTSPDDTKGPHVVALDAHDGTQRWRSAPVATENGAYTNSSAVYYDGMVWIGVSNPEQGFHYVGGFAILDAEDGSLLARTKTIPPDQSAQGYAGGSIWSTAAVDENGWGYASTGQPSPWTGKESELVNAIVKFDFARARNAAGDKIESDTITNPKFGTIVGAIKGTWDRGFDLDFAGSPTLYDDAHGRQMVAAYQKSGVLHAGHTRYMTHAWSTPLSPVGAALGNYSSTATDGANVYGVGTYPGQVWKINGTTGLPAWVSPVVTTLGGNPVQYANGVVYHADGKGFLDAYDAETGVPLLHRPMQADVGGTCVNLGGGLAIARNTVYSVCGERSAGGGIGPSNAATGWVIAYRLPPA